MKITVEFSSLAEFFAHVKHGEGFLEQEAAAEPSKFEQAQAKARAVAAEPVDTGTGTIVGATPEEQIEAEEAPTVTEEYRVEVRKTLAELNKAAKKNVATELIKRVTGCKTLKDVPLEMLPAIMNAAKEEKYA